MEPYVGQILLAGFSYAPDGYALCNGQQLLVQQNMALYSLLGSTFGGDNKTVFNLPDLQGRTMIGQGVSHVSGKVYTIGTAGGVEGVALTSAQVPAHAHVVKASTSVGTALPSAGVPSAPGPTKKVTTTANMYAPPNGNTPSGTAGALVPLNAATVSTTGSGAAHNNMQPFQVIAAIIAIVGYYPQRS